MKPGLMQVHMNSLMEFMEKRQLHPIKALEVMSFTSNAILGGYIEHDMTPEEKTQLGMEVEKFSAKLRELIQFTEGDLFAVLLCTQVLNKELIESAVLSIEEAAKEAVKKNAPTVPMS
jgi:hypothetical protein